MTAKNSKKDIGQPISSLLKINDKKVNDMKPNYTNSTQAQLFIIPPHIGKSVIKQKQISKIKKINK